MKRLGLFVAAVLMSATVSFASNKKTSVLCKYISVELLFAVNI